MPTSFFSLRRSASYTPVSSDFEDEYDDEQGPHGIQLQQNSQQENISVEDDHHHPIGTFRIDDDDDNEFDDVYDDDDAKYDNIDLERQLDSTHDSATCSSLSTTTRSDESKGKIPVNFVCPLTLQVMTDPVNDGCGHCFERGAISSWLEYHEMCPISRKPLHYGDLKPADALATRMQEWREQRTDVTESSSSSASTTTNMSSMNGSHNYFASSSPVPPPGMIVESMLLPQELEVLKLIKGKARDRQARHRLNNNLWAIALIFGVILFLAMCFAIKYLELELRGPI